MKAMAQAQAMAMAMATAQAQAMAIQLRHVRYPSDPHLWEKHVWKQ